MPSPEVLGITNGPFAVNSWLVWDPASREAVVVDPGAESHLILAAITERGLRVGAVWLTHAHLDHLSGVDAVRAATGAPALLHPADRPLYDAYPKQFEYFGLPAEPALRPLDGELADGEGLSLGPWRFAVRHVPGHSPGHVAFIGHGLALSGDVLFLDSIGRTDLPGCEPSKLEESLQRVMMALPDATRVLPGHGPETTIGRERRHNPFLVHR